MADITGIKGGWNETKEKLKLKFAILTDDSTLSIEDNQGKWSDRHQSKLSKLKKILKN